MWASTWVGLPYRKMGRGPAEYDCLGLFLELQRVRMHRELPDPAVTAAEAARRRTHEAQDGWQQVLRAREGDALLFRVRGHVLHVGYALDERDMLHIEDHMTSMIERWNGPLWRRRLEGIFRYV